MIVPHQSSQYYESLIMREDVQFSIDLLNAIGDEPHWPSKLNMRDFSKEFPDKSQAEIAYHLNCCEQAGLIEAKIKPSRTIGDRDREIPIEVFITGLTSQGNNYLANIQKEKPYSGTLRYLNVKAWILQPRHSIRPLTLGW